MGKVLVDMQEGNVLSFRADVLALKYAQDLYGADRAVYEYLTAARRKSISLPDIGEIALIDTDGLLDSRQVLFVGVEPLFRFDYQRIREFGRSVMVYLAAKTPQVKHVALTIHGPGYGLDEIESFESELGGISDAILTGDYPADLARISFVERNSGRVRRLQDSLANIFPDGILNGRSRSFGRSIEESEGFLSAGSASADKPWIFVAMPFEKSMDDLFHYGIQGAVKASGFLCERADFTSFTGDVMNWVKRRIEGAAFVVADLSTANPNVYLEVGYAWGCGRPTVLIARSADELKFDVKSQRCLVYESIKHLEEILGNELKVLTG
jgi:hypothetical protein